MVAQRQYQYGTSPRKLEQQPVRKKSKKKNVKVNKKKLLQHKIRIFSSIGIMFAIMFAISYRYSFINQQYNNIRSLKKEYNAMITTNDQIEIGIQNSLDLTQIERYAKDKLGMQKPLASQIKYIEIEKEDKVELNTQVTSNKSMFQNFFDEMAKILD